MRRQFNTAERTAALILQQGKCAICKTPLSKGFHADHITPYSKGGVTDVSNLQALCTACNLHKGATVPMNSLKSILPFTAPAGLREWQKEAYNAYFNRTSREFLVVATPGAGKTSLALQIAKTEIQQHWRDVKRVVIVVPTTHLKQQWCQAAQNLGLPLIDFDNSYGAEPDDTCGLVTTYASVVRNSTLYAMQTHKPTLTILDEIHHAGDDSRLSWGPAIKHAFQHSEAILTLSGTPFRSDNAPIAFIKYDDSNQCVPDYEYSYAQALQDGIVREVYFPSFKAECEWLEGGNMRHASFADASASDEVARKLLYVASRTDNCVEMMFQDAHRNLERLRTSEHPEAAGLIISVDIDSAKRNAEIVRRVTGRMPPVVTSEDSIEATRAISSFIASNEPWIVSVRMVSEGVDIPRLRMLIYATDITSRLFFSQAIGRTVRKISNKINQSSYVYIYDNPELHKLAIEYIETRAYVLQALAEECKREGSERTNSSISRSSIIPYSGTAEHSQTIFQGAQYLDLLPYAKALASEEGLPDAKVHVLLTKFMERLPFARNEQAVTVSPSPVQTNDVQPADPAVVPYKNEHKFFKTAVHNLTGKLIATRLERRGYDRSHTSYSQRFSEEIKHYNSQLNKRYLPYPYERKRASVPQLQQMIAHVEQDINYEIARRS